VTDLAIQAHGLGKQYRLGTGTGDRYETLRTVLTSKLTSPFRRRRPRRGPTHVWALRDVTFDVAPGEIVGIIGRNGVGKSTLLKVLSRITEPTEGWFELRGRVGSLLEVGTGVHPELTGRENIYLSGAILGMRRAEINRRFDEIVAFAEIDDFLDTPMKRYSSGMYVRLGFAVAAHLEPEILLVDEVLAVGDVSFQKKCLGKMGEVAGEGRTILFVSHNMAMIQSLCERGIFLDRGDIAFDGDVDKAIATYLRSMEEASVADLRERVDRQGRGRIRITHIEIDSDGAATLASGRRARFRFHTSGRLPGADCFFTIYNHVGQPIAHFATAIHGEHDRDGDGSPRYSCDIPELLLLPGRYLLSVGLQAEGELEDQVEAARVFDVEQGSVAGRPISRDRGYGSVLMPHEWTRLG
jgi:lipopolysaccharide transport system ATP-binding protein